jgi:hypothetical protein
MVTTEWVALAGAIIIRGITIAWLVLNSLQTPASNVDTDLTSCESITVANSGDTSGRPSSGLGPYKPWMPVAADAKKWGMAGVGAARSALDSPASRDLANNTPD